MKKLQILAPFRHCVGTDVHPTQFVAGVQEVDDRTYQVAIENGWGCPAKAGKTDDGDAGKGGKADNPEFTADDVNKVIAMADTPGVHFKTFEKEAKKILGDETPSKEDEIVAALKKYLEAL